MILTDKFCFIVSYENASAIIDNILLLPSTPQILLSNASWNASQNCFVWFSGVVWRNPQLYNCDSVSLSLSGFFDCVQNSS